MPPLRDGLKPCRAHIRMGKRYWSKSLWVEANWSMESLNLIYTHIGGVHPQLSRADKEYYLSFRLTPPRWIFGYFLLRANKANAWSQQSRLNYLPTLEVYCLGNLSSKWQNESTLHRFLSARCDVIHSWRVDSKLCWLYTFYKTALRSFTSSWDEHYTCVICKQQLFLGWLALVCSNKCQMCQHVQWWTLHLYFI